MVTGIIKRFNDSKFFIYNTTSYGSQDIFVLHSAITGSGFKTLSEVQRVTFKLEQGPKGPSAADVVPA